MPDAIYHEATWRVEHALRPGILTRDRLLSQGEELLQLGC